MAPGPSPLPAVPLSALPSEARRYEPFVRRVPAGTRVRSATWRHRRWDVHVEAIGDDDAPVRALLIHGAGGNAAAMRPFAAHIATARMQVLIADMPGYGRTAPARDPDVTYGDWQELLVDLTARIADRPLIVIGASMGGMLAYDTGAVSPHVDAVVATCLLDLSDVAVLCRVSRWPLLASAVPASLALARGPLASTFLPLTAIAPMELIANDPGLTEAVAADPRGGAGAMPLGWFRTLVAGGPVIAPERYSGPPVTLVHPAEDRWTPAEVSLAFHSRLPGDAHAAHLLEGSGHFPVEEPGFSRLLEVLAETAEDVTAQTDRRSSLPSREDRP